MTTFFDSVFNQDADEIDKQHNVLLHKLCSVVNKANNERCAIRNILPPTTFAPLQSKTQTQNVMKHQETVQELTNGEEVTLRKETHTITKKVQGKTCKVDVLRFHCLNCERTMDSMYNFEHHKCHKVMPKQPTNTTYQCIYCSKTCSTNHNKLTHEKTCSLKRECDYCKKRIDITKLTNHMKWCKNITSRHMIWCNPHK